MIDLDPILLSRIQFAFVISFHIIFPSLTIGLASWLATIEYLWLKTKQPAYKSIYNMWAKVFAIAFVMGVVSGVVMPYQFGTNWSTFSHKAGNVIGPLLGFEVMTAFFLEATFLGIMLFGWKRVSPRLHFISTIMVAIGTLVSAFWILAVNSWMQTPAGFRIEENGILYPTDWIKVIFNPSFPYHFAHMIAATYVTTAFIITGVAAWYLKKKTHIIEAKIMLTMAILVTSVLAPLQIIIGDMHGLNTLKHQPAKIAAIEGLYEDSQPAPFHLFCIPNDKQNRCDYSISIPKLGSILLTHSLNGEVKGLNSFPQSRPPSLIIFFAFRIMVGIGFLMLITAGIGLYLLIKDKLFSSKIFHNWVILFAPMGLVAILVGWFVTEIGRQPYLVYGVLKTADMASPIPGDTITASLIAFMIIYTSIFGAGIYYIFKLIKIGPNNSTDHITNNKNTNITKNITVSNTNNIKKQSIIQNIANILYLNK